MNKTTSIQEQQTMIYPRRILLAVTGLSPQVVTETLYALAVRQRPPFIPTEVHLLTTVEGAQRARLALLSDDPGWFHRLRKDYGLPEIAFDENHIHVLTAADGTPLSDIRSPQDNECAADAITEMVRAFTEQPDTALHVSIAGGRKTMGFYLGYALSLFGRAQDRLSHVLVSEPFESSWDFFYPTPYSRVLATRDNKLADARDAQVTLADIPFFSLRHDLPEHLRKGRARYSELVAAARAAVGPAELIIDPVARRIRAAGRIVELPPAELAMLALFARRAQQNLPALKAPGKGVPDPEWAERFLSEYRAICGEMADIDDTERALRKGMDGDYFSSRLSKLKRKLERALGPAARPYLIDGGSTRPRRYRLALPPEAIRFDEV
ncbi:MAG: CRISPR-associated ring nuclease Csm6 [Gammaproteobacteria bacterium]